jgi:hypothetical protein
MCPKCLSPLLESVNKSEAALKKDLDMEGKGRENNFFL